MGEEREPFHAKSNSITTMRLIRSDSANVIRTGIQALSEGLLYHGNPDESFAVTMGTFPRMEHTYLTYMRQSVLGSLMQYGFPFLCRRHDDSILISCCKNSCLPRNSRKAALPGWLSGKKSSSLRSVFFPPSLAGMRANRQQGQQEIRMPVPYRQTMYNNKYQKS